MASGATAEADAEPTELTDDQLAAMARSDAAAFAQLYRRYLTPVYRYALRRLGEKEAAEDATSAIFTNALAALPRYRTGSFRSWLFTIAHNVVVSGHRQRRPQESLDAAGELRDPSPGPEAALLAAEARDETHALLARLTPRERDVIDLRLAGLSGREIAAVLGISHSAVKVAQFRAIARLKTLLAATPGKDE